MNFTYDNYKLILKDLKKKNYNFVYFDSVIKKEPFIILRHDIDIDIYGALQMAKIEHELGICSTWYVMPNNRLYNLLDNDVINILKLIHQYGHKIGLHIDISNHTNENNLEEELIKFYDYYSKYIPLSKTFSFHVPNPEIIDNNIKIKGFINAYENEFYKELSYVSDSNRRPFLEEERFAIAIKNKSSMQLLIHPIWWKTQNLEKTQIIEYIKDYAATKLINKTIVECKF